MRFSQNADVSLQRFICEDNKSYSRFHFQPVTNKTEMHLLTEKKNTMIIAFKLTQVTVFKKNAEK